MERALELARRALGSVSPNPAVGAVLMYGGEAVGEGYTQPPGGPHAEVVALAAAGERARGAALYVTLEPCSSHGRTPPCTQAILDAGVAEVHAALVDPDPRARGRGLEVLRRAGLSVQVGEGEEAAQILNEAYCKHRQTGLPFVILKFAASLDGRIATAGGESRWVSGPQARGWAHRLRATVDAVAVGSGTVLADDPLLTARPEGEPPPRQPLRVVLDARGRVPPGARVFGPEAPTLVATTEASPEGWRARLTAGGAQVQLFPAADAGGLQLGPLLRHLGERGMLSLLVEGGAALLGAFVDDRLLDKVHAVLAPKILGGRGALAAVGGRGAQRLAEALLLERVTCEPLGGDILVTGYAASWSV